MKDAFFLVMRMVCVPGPALGHVEVCLFFSHILGEASPTQLYLSIYLPIYSSYPYPLPCLFHPTGAGRVKHARQLEQGQHRLL